MKKLLLLTLIIGSLHNLHSQEIYLYSGKNYTQYDFKDNTGTSNPSLQTGSGNFYEMGYAMPLGNEKINYAIGLNLNEYNALGGNTFNSCLFLANNSRKTVIDKNLREHEFINTVNTTNSLNYPSWVIRNIKIYRY